MIKIASRVFLAISMLLVGVDSVMGQGGTRPNVMIVLVDDMGVMDTSVSFLLDEQGKAIEHPLNRWYQTPNMER
ncbi:MAG: N-acetylgalactosamine-6-sulfatase, partial [Pirellula sp.]